MIYLVEDDESIRELVVYTLNSQGMEAEGFGTPSDFWKALENKIPDLILLDIMLPEEDGLDILVKLRKKSETKNLPIAMLTAKGSEYDTVKGLDSGADRRGRLYSQAIQDDGTGVQDQSASSQERKIRPGGQGIQLR